MSEFQVQFDQYFEVANQEQKTIRNGDWVCVKCSNLNFSFRKRCNRCKNQTRQQNDQNMMQMYNYYQQYYHQPYEYNMMISQTNEQAKSFHENIEQVGQQSHQNKSERSINTSVSQNSSLSLHSILSHSLEEQQRRQYKKQRTFSSQNLEDYLNQLCWDSVLEEQFYTQQEYNSQELYQQDEFVTQLIGNVFI